jgi:O-antigen ligase
MKSQLKPEWQRRSHNQFLSIMVGFGVFGLMLFLFCLIYPPLKMNSLRDFRFAYFFLIIIMSMIVEDTIESQDGVTFVAFFFAFLLFISPDKKTIFAGEQQNS